MIPIKKIGDLKEYDAYIDQVKEGLTKIIDKGYRGNLQKKKVSEIHAYYNTLPPSIQIKYQRAVGFKTFNRFIKLSSDVIRQAPKRMLSYAEVDLLTRLRDNLYAIAYAKGKDLRKIIDTYQHELPLDAEGKLDKASDIHEAIKSVFITNGYEKKEFKEAVWKVTNLRVCPYCNRTYIPLISWEEDGSSIKGQLDHFYPKEKYPYLAISLYNLVPSCTYCNGSSCKGTKDPYTENIVNPFVLKDHRGLRFRLTRFDKGILDLDKCADSLELGIDTSLNKDMANNDNVFHLKDIYSYHKDIAAEIIFKHRASMSVAYLNFLKDITKASVSQWTMKDFFKLYWGVPLEDDQLGERPMSKFTLDLINDLNERYFFKSIVEDAKND